MIQYKHNDSSDERLVDFMVVNYSDEAILHRFKEFWLTLSNNQKVELAGLVDGMQLRTELAKFKVVTGNIKIQF
jgi:hypothetical protein